MTNVQQLALEVHSYTQQRLPQYIEELKMLCSIDSYSYYKAGLDEIASRLGERMRGLDHSPAEYLNISSIAPRTALLAGLLASIS